jgi:hypothetical protein
MAQKIYNLDSFPQGYYMSWFVTTQAAFEVTATLSDSSGVYFSQKKQGIDISPPLAQGASTVNGTNLILTIDIPQSPAILNSLNSYNITRPDGSTVGYGFNITIEDGTDNDFNDVCISLVAWFAKG